MPTPIVSSYARLELNYSILNHLDDMLPMTSLDGLQRGMRINHCSINTLMTEQFAYVFDRHTALQGSSRRGMSEDMRSYWLTYLIGGSGRDVSNHLFDSIFRQGSNRFAFGNKQILTVVSA